MSGAEGGDVAICRSRFARLVRDARGLPVCVSPGGLRLIVDPDNVYSMRIAALWLNVSLGELCDRLNVIAPAGAESEAP